MTDEARVEQLLDELLDSDVTPEFVCGSCPELLPHVRERWRQICHARDELDALFPPLAEQSTKPAAARPSEIPLPAIPGYEVDSVLGVGGMGVVFRARHLGLNRVVALKMALAGAYAGAHERARFQREAEAVAALTHPNVVQVHDVGESDGRPYFTMEYVDGGSLARRLAGTPQPAREAAALLATLATAVDVAHTCGIVHRDLKPANVLLTADGTPKISDFGLARRVGGEPGLTRTGAVLGTPSYMAPEQARGQADAIGPAADIYALGAILYEALTGRPPFIAESSAETVLALLTRDPVPPSRLNGKVPRDLETVCLKCLHKEPGCRYVTTGALAEDLRCFLRGEAIAARPERPVARLVRRVRGRPALSAAVATSAIFAITLIGTGLWLLDKSRTSRAELAATEHAAAADLEEMEAALRNSSWTAARAARERAKGRLGDRGSADIRGRLDRDAQELALAEQLEAISLRGTLNLDGSHDHVRSNKDYESAFQVYGQVHDAPEVVAERIAASHIRDALLDALDHWAGRTTDRPLRDWVLLVARETEKRRVDRDPTGWRDKARDPAILQDETALDLLIRETRFAEQSVPLLLRLAQFQREKGKNPIRFLKRMQAAHPADFWANLALGDFLLGAHDYREALRYLQAALTIRPESTFARVDLGFAMEKIGQIEEAIEQYRLALAIDPNSSTRIFLADALSMQDRFDESIEECRRVLADFPNEPYLRALLGRNLLNTGRNEDALQEYQEALKIDPNRPDALLGLRQIYMQRGRVQDACAAWGKALEAQPPLEYKYWYGYAEYCLYLGKEEEYRRARKALLSTFGATTDPQIAERVGRACLLSAATGDELGQAAALADRAASADGPKYQWLSPYGQFVKGLADYRLGRFEQAIKVLQGAPSQLPGPTPRLVLAMALHQAGHQEEARKTLEAAIQKYEWRPNEIRDQDDCIKLVLRREAERLIQPAAK